MSGEATVICGADRLTLGELVGVTVEDVREDYSSLLNIPDSATPLVNGRTVDEGYSLKAGDELIFSRPVGQKG